LDTRDCPTITRRHKTRRARAFFVDKLPSSFAIPVSAASPHGRSLAPRPGQGG
jgi:hypothetical protein